MISGISCGRASEDDAMLMAAARVVGNATIDGWGERGEQFIVQTHSYEVSLNIQEGLNHSEEYKEKQERRWKDGQR